MICLSKESIGEAALYASPFLYRASPLAEARQGDSVLYEGKEHESPFMLSFFVLKEDLWLIADRL